MSSISVLALSLRPPIPPAQLHVAKFVVVRKDGVFAGITVISMTEHPRFNERVLCRRNQLSRPTHFLPLGSTCQQPK